MKKIQPINVSAENLLEFSPGQADIIIKLVTVVNLLVNQSNYSRDRRIMIERLLSDNGISLNDSVWGGYVQDENSN